MTTYSLLCPTRSRATRAVDFAESAIRTAKHPERLELLFYLDDNDPELQSYYKGMDALKGRLVEAGNIQITEGPEVGVPRATNVLANKSKSEIIMYTSDDQVYIDHGWDSRLDKEVAKYPDRIFCIWFNDGWESEKFCTFPIVSRQWIETLGYFLFPFFEHFFTDTWIWMLAKSVDRAIYIPDVLIEHRHWKIGKSEKDETYERNATFNGDSRHARDWAVIDQFECYFLADVKLLQNSIR